MKQASARKGVVLALTCLVQFMVVLDISIVNVALPSIQQDLDLAQGTLQWLVIAYALLLGGFVLLGGRAADLVGRRRVLVTGLVLFSGASLVAALGTSAAILIAARGVQGFGAALMAPAALSIIAITFAEGAERNRALGIFGAVGGTTAAIGVIASGYLTAGPGWRWAFFINVPIGIALLVLAVAVLAKDRPRARGRQFDAGGAVSVTAALLALVFALNRGADYGWGSRSTLALFGAAILLLGAFVGIEQRSAEPLIPMSVVRNRPLVVANTMAFIAFGGFYSFIFLGSLLMQQVLGYSPTKTGSAWLATLGTAFVVALITGARLVAVHGHRRLLIVAMTLLTMSGLWLTRVPVAPRYVTDLLPSLVLAGIALGLASVSVQISALAGVTRASAGLASGLVETMREVGGAVGVAAVSTVLIGGAAASPGAVDRTGLLDTFHAGYVVIAAFAAVGALLAALGYGRSPAIAPAPEAPQPALGAAAD